MKASHVKAWRIVLAGWLFGWFCKVQFYVPYLYKTVWEAPVRSDFFPGMFMNNAVSALFYILPAICVAAFFSHHLSVMRSCGWVMLLSSVVMNLHLNTYNDATFVTSFWVALWILWMVEAMRKDDRLLVFQASILAQLIIALMFLGGLVGKLTPEYLSGDVIYFIFYAQTKVSFLGFLVRGASPLTQMAFFGIIAKLIIGAEFLLALNFLLPFMVAFYLGVTLIPLLIFFSTWRILSVISALLALLVGCYVLHRRTDGEQFA